jgi:polysaccharide biosynthesis protein PslG
LVRNYDPQIVACLSKLAGCRPRAKESLVLGLVLALAFSLTAWMLPVGGAIGAQSALAAPLGGVNVPGLGPSTPPSAADREIARAASVHARVVRVAIPWSVLEPIGPGQISPQALAFTDRLVGDAAAHGIRVIMTVDSTPCWATSAPAAVTRGCVGSRGSAANAWPPLHPAEYGAFVAYLAQRYGTRLAAIEIWNEPDQANQLYFAGPEKPQRYAAILRAAYTAIKAANPQVTVIGGSLVGSNGVFLRELYAAGIKGYYDGLAVHFYTLTLGALRSIHEVQLANGDSKPLWLDEFGWSSCYPRHKIQEEQACVTPAVQATNITQVFRSIAHTSYVAAAALYDLQDSGFEEFGVLRSSGAHKPSFSALAHVLLSPFGSVAPVTLSLRRHGARVVASGTAPVGDFMQLEVSIGGVPRYRALFTLDRFNRYSISLPAALGTQGLSVRVYQYWAGSRRAAQRSL